MAMMQGQCPVGGLEGGYNPFVAPQLEDPYPVWARAREGQPVFRSDVLGAWVVTRYDDVVGVLRDPVMFGQNSGRKMFAQACPEADRILAELPPLSEVVSSASDGATHKKLRRYLQDAFLPRRAAVLEPRLRGICSDLINGFEGDGRGDLYEVFAYPYPFLAICDLVGLPEEYHEQVTRWADSQAKLRYGNLSPQEQVVLAGDLRDFYVFNGAFVRRRRAEPGDDLLSWIIQDSDASEDPLSEAQLAYQIQVLLSSGHETSTSFVMMVMARLLRDRARWASLAADPGSAKAVVQELLRLDGPVQSVWRRARAGAVIGGVEIPEGDLVSLVIGSANADAAAFASPLDFEPGRANANRHVGFGRGVHSCVGAPFALLVAEIEIESLAARLPKLRLAADPGLVYEPSANMRKPQQLNVEWT
jgi:cytochrome P450